MGIHADPDPQPRIYKLFNFHIVACLGPLGVLFRGDVGEGGLYDPTPVLVHRQLPRLWHDLVEHLHDLLTRPALEIFLKREENSPPPPRIHQCS